MPTATQVRALVVRQPSTEGDEFWSGGDRPLLTASG